MKERGRRYASSAVSSGSSSPVVISVQAVGGVLVAAPDLNVEDKLNFYGASRAGKEKLNIDILSRLKTRDSWMQA